MGAGTSPRSFGWRVFETACIALAVLIIASVLWFAVDILLLLFAAVLLANVLRAPTAALRRRSPLPDGVVLMVVILAIFGLFGAIGTMLVPQLDKELPVLIKSLGDTLQGLLDRVGFEEWAEGLAKDVDLLQVIPSPAGLVGGATGIIASTFGILANVLILVVVTIYFAADPKLYLDGATLLVPEPKRERARHILETIGRTLRWWFIGQLVSMTVVGVMTYVGLSLLGVPLAMTLAVIAFLLTFIPFLGPILAAVPVFLAAFAEGPETAVWAMVYYTLIQSFEGYILTPLVQRRSVALPPALTVTAQILLGVILGPLGVILATPLAAAGLVTVKMLYIEDVLGEEVEIQVEEEAGT
ncbi:MAG TPA: AI-2E family transporter [Geminicoccaceae bacterium]